MQNIRVINPLRHFFQQPVMPDIVKVGSQVKVEDARLLMDNCLCYPLDRVMRCPLGPISKRPRLEIRFENRLEDELERPLHHPDVLWSRFRSWSAHSALPPLRVRRKVREPLGTAEIGDMRE